MNYFFSIIVPIYNAQNYIAQCARSLFGQNFKNIEYIFVDDCSSDNSLGILKEVLKEFPDRYTSVKIIKNHKNMGVSFTRKVGMESTTGQYVIQIDSDDWVDLDMCNAFYKKIKETNADIICSDYYENYLGRQDYIEQNYGKDVDYFKAILDGRLHGSLCNKMIKRSLFVDNNIYPILGFNLFEDKFVSLRLFFFSNKVEYINSAFLHYRQYDKSFTNQPVNESQIYDTIFFINELQKFFETNKLLSILNNEFYGCILNHKKIFLLDEQYFYLWDSFYPEANKIKYLLTLKSYSLIKKIITALTLLFSKKIMKFAYTIHKKNKGL